METSPLNRRQRYQLGQIYDAIARLMPVEGRDYTLNIEFDGDQPRIQMRGLNAFGNQWASYCVQQLPKLLGARKQKADQRGRPQIAINPDSIGRRIQLARATRAQPEAATDGVPGKQHVL